jgi:hypothetical protein
VRQNARLASQLTLKRHEDVVDVVGDVLDVEGHLVALADVG